MKKKNIVKSSQGKVYLLIAALLVVIWIVSLALLTSNTDKKEQLNLVAEADKFLEDEIYIRAANSLKEALGYETEYNRKIEDKLLDVYKTGGFAEEYENLAKQRIDAGYASAEEYLFVAKARLSKSNTASAIEILKRALENYQDDEELSELYDGSRFEISRANTGYSEYINPIEKSNVPVFDGEKWGFLDENGRLAINHLYKDVTPFSGNYAVVKADSQYEIIDTSCNRWGLDKNGLDDVVMYNSKKIVGKKGDSYGIYSQTFKQIGSESYEDVILNSNGLVCVKKGGRWAILDNDLKQVTDFVFVDVVRNSRGEAYTGSYIVLADEQGYFIANQEGKAIFDKRFKKAKGFEGGAVAVSDETGKWGFINSKGELIIPCKYMDAKSFSCDLAPIYEAGEWRYITRKDVVVYENNLSEAEPFNEGCALAKDGNGNLLLLKLRYYEYYK